MYLIEVIPVSRLPRSLPDAFSYFAPQPLSPGTAVEVRIQNRLVLALVVRVSAVKDVKQELRRAEFTLRKIERVLSPAPIFNTRDLEFLFQFSNYYIAPPALVLKLLIPPPVASAKLITALPPRPNPTTALPSAEVIIGSDRIPRYAEAARAAIDANHQVLIITPEIRRAQSVSETLGIENAVITSRTPSAQFRKTWLAVRAGAPTIVIGTHSALFLPYADLGLIVIDDDGSPYHKSWDQEPRYGNRDVAKMLQTLHGAKLIYGGMPPSLEAYSKAKENPVTALTTLPEPHLKTLSLFADMQKEMKEAGSFVVLSQVVKDKLRAVMEEGGRAFLFVNRKGFAPFILCQECGEAFRCSNCAAPLVYHAQESLAEATLLCHHCSAKQPAPDVCKQCGSHRLKAYGIAVERVVSDVKKLFPGIPVIGLSADEERRPLAAAALLKLKKLDSYIAVGTEYAVSESALPAVDLAAIISIDTALNLPDFYQNERLFRILSMVRRLATKHFILQSFSKEPELLYDLFHGTFEHFAEKELKERRRFHYPPFGELVKLTVRDARQDAALARVKRLRRELELVERRHPEALEITNPYPAYVEKKKGRFIFHILLKITRGEESERVKATLREFLPPDILVDVGPMTLL